MIVGCGDFTSSSEWWNEGTQRRYMFEVRRPSLATDLEEGEGIETGCWVPVNAYLRRSFFGQHLQRYIHYLTIENIDLRHQCDRCRLPFDRLCRLGQCRVARARK